MANTKSAKKAIRSQERKRQYNLKRLTEFRLARKQVKKAVESGNAEEAKKLLSFAYKKIDKAAKSGPISKNAASRYKSKLAKLVESITK
ncbi:MAG: 30S ribosomal protein S20 [Candidatus Dojkabacteria bacterium]|nr:MAG: 30S ribosomal protein S20 [Candidatus Dojkabacteria bacterium]